MFFNVSQNCHPWVILDTPALNSQDYGSKPLIPRLWIYIPGDTFAFHTWSQECGSKPLIPRLWIYIPGDTFAFHTWSHEECGSKPLIPRLWIYIPGDTFAFHTWSQECGSKPLIPTRGSIYTIYFAFIVLIFDLLWQSVCLPVADLLVCLLACLCAGVSAQRSNWKNLRCKGDIAKAFAENCRTCLYVVCLLVCLLVCMLAGFVKNTSGVLIDPIRCTETQNVTFYISWLHHTSGEEASWLTAKADWVGCTGVFGDAMLRFVQEGFTTPSSSVPLPLLGRVSKCMVGGSQYRVSSSWVVITYTVSSILVFCFVSYPASRWRTERKWWWRC